MIGRGGQIKYDWSSESGPGKILHKPTVPGMPVNADWNSNSGLSQILNRPTLAQPIGVPIWGMQLTTDEASDLQGYTVRHVFYQPPAVGQQIRALFVANGSIATRLAHVSVSLWSGTLADGIDAMYEMTFDNGSSGAVIAAGTAKWTDWTYYAGSDYISPTWKGIVIVWDHATGSASRQKYVSGVAEVEYFKAATASYNSLSTPAGYTMSNTTTRSISRIQVRNVDQV